MRTIIAGCRDFEDYDRACDVLDAMGWKPSIVISGGARGADKLGETWAISNQIPFERYPADWDLYGKSAGYKRNTQMAAAAEALIAFWDGKSKGTGHMIDIAKKQGLFVRVYDTHHDDVQHDDTPSVTEFFTYDIETYPNCFTFAVERLSDRAQWVFEISWRKDDSQQLMQFMTALVNTPNVAMVGFNSLGFDYPVVHEFYKSNGTMGYDGLYAKSQTIFDSQRGDGFGHMIWESDRVIPQIDLFKINHFDNKAKSTGLKMIEFNMRVPNLADLPYTPGTMLDSEQIDNLIHYNLHGDVVNTRELLLECMPAIEFRQKLTAQYDRDFMNHNDTKIGKDYLIMELEKAGIPCYTKIPGQSKQPIQTHRPTIALKDAIFDYIEFRHPEFQRIHQWLLAQKITETKGTFKDISCTINNFEYVFGLGGIHGSVESQTIYSDDEWIVEDWDVKAYYPSLGVANQLYPEHLGPEFPKHHGEVITQRDNHKKGTAENKMLKLAANGSFGDSNSKFSPFYDPLYTMSITVNGQLLLCMLAENLMVVPNLTMIQINTDGLTVRYRRKDMDSVHRICQWWEGFTKLQLEHVEYSRMFIKDVNNYTGEFTDGTVKLKGAYASKREHHQNHSALVVPKVAEMVLVHGVNIEDTVRSWPDIYDFMLRVRVGQKDRLMLNEQQQQRTTRYYVSETGGTLIAIRPPPVGKVIGDYKKTQGVSDAAYNAGNITGIHNPDIHTKNKSIYGESRTEVEKGYKTTVANDMMDCTASINYNYYIDRVKKLVEPLR